MLRKIIPLILMATPLVTYAGLFNSAPELKCGDVDAVVAAKDWIYNDALGHLQHDYLSDSSLFFGLPQSDYEQQLRAIPVQLSDIVTQSSSSEVRRNCSAKVSAAIPQATLDFLKVLPDTLKEITQGYGQVLNNQVVWKDFTYDIQLADNNKDIIVTPSQSAYTTTSSIYYMATMAVSKDSIIKKKNDSEVYAAAEAYSGVDRELNEVWKMLPDSARAALKKEQQTWVNQKSQKCGKLSDAQSETLPAAQRISIYQCQSRLTDKRIEYLGGDDTYD